ncbi:MAG: glycosyltransferase family 2 protein [Nanoarchaeota archaeon]|nr:glycosyltransferase family 2 protein [Nanoarchaeota archaeon]
MQNKSVWVVIPAYNESRHISDVIKKTKKYVNNIIVVDDGSRDDTYKIAKRLDVYALKNIVNMGKGAALKTGCDFAMKNKADIIIAMDADGQHNPDDIPRILEALKDKDIVFSYRRFTRQMPFILKIGNILINKFIKLLYSVELKDTQCGFRAFTSESYKKIRWTHSDYSMESEMIANTGKHDLKYGEIPIKTIYSNKYKGTTIIDGFKIVFNMLLWRFKR